MDTLEHKLKELKGMSDALWESHDHWVGTLEERMDVHGSRSNKTPQLNKQLVMIKETQKQLRNAMKTLSTKVTYSIVAFRSKINKLAAMVKVIMMAIG